MFCKAPQEPSKAARSTKKNSTAVPRASSVCYVRLEAFFLPLILWRLCRPARILRNSPQCCVSIFSARIPIISPILWPQPARHQRLLAHHRWRARILHPERLWAHSSDLSDLASRAAGRPQRRPRVLRPRRPCAAYAEVIIATTRAGRTANRMRPPRRAERSSSAAPSGNRAGRARAASTEVPPLLTVLLP